MSEQKREQWGSKVGFVLAAAGSAIGLGNIWKFPYVTGENGGAAFVLIYLISVVLLGLPIMIAELVIGRHTEKDPVGAFKAMLGGTGWVIIGYMGVLSGFFILSFYSVIGGWTLGYIVNSITGLTSSLKDVGTAKVAFNEFTHDTVMVVLYHFLFIAACVFIVIRGIKNGIEKWSKVLMPLLFIIIIVLIVRGLSMDGAIDGVAFFLKPDFSKINTDSVLSALGQSFFSLSLGMGAIITYGSYLSREDKILHSAIYIVILDTVIAIMAGLAIFPAVFAMGLNPNSGPGLIYHVIPAVFANMAYGGVFATLFFMLLFIAALTSGISLLEVVVAYITDEKGWSRKKAVLIFGTVIFLLGVPSALSFNVMENITVFVGNNFFDFMDKLTSNFMLPIGGFFIAIALGWKYGLDKTMHELDPDTRIISLKELWAFTIKFVSPILVLLVFIFNFIRQIGD
ncbi:MAG TPA: sodium-dependent transporter [Spirochaetota bacterium]|nr:sodium-dependent transporter [Spirochaetota bacterium]HPI89078.1 sodium-dependent transporter [Spirochaetota bacterium]HPR48711.1 sodium-dependent transporter [Spirochaetota bacterium]